jgi:hypothetical protein
MFSQDAAVTSLRALALLPAGVFTLAVLLQKKSSAAGEAVYQFDMNLLVGMLVALWVWAALRKVKRFDDEDRGPISRAVTLLQILRVAAVILSPLWAVVAAIAIFQVMVLMH